MAPNGMGARSKSTDQRSDSTDSESRRKFLAGLGAAGLASVAGCGGGGGNTTTTTTTQNNNGGSDTTTTSESMVAEGVVDAQWTGAIWDTTDKLQFNLWNGENQLGLLNGTIYDELATFNEVNREFVPILAKDWNYKADQGILTVTLRDGLTWHNGEPITAEDIAVRWRLEKYVTAQDKALKQDGKVVSESGFWAYGDKVTAKNDSTVEFSVPDPVNSDLLLSTVLWDQVRVPRFLYSQWIDRFENAKSDPKKYNSVRQEFTSWKQTNPVGSSPWKVDKIATNKVTMKRYADHPFAENINFNTYVRLTAKENKSHWALYKAGRTNMLEAAAPDSVEQSFPDTVISVPDLIPNYFGSCLGINFNHPVLGKRKVRQALTYAIDARNPADAAGGYIPVTDNFTGIGGGPAGVPETVLGDVADSYTDYDITEGTGGEDWKKAEALLKEAGLSKENGTWMRENGKPFKLPMKVVAAHSDMVRMFQAVVGQLKQFGIDATMETVEGATFWDMRERGDFAIAEAFWVNVFPSNAFYDRYWGFAQENDTHPTWGYPAVVEDLPRPPFMSGSSDTVDIPVRELAQQAQVEPDPEKQREILRKLAWAFNHDIPRIPIEERMLGYKIHPKGQGRDFIVPTPDDPKGAAGSGGSKKDLANGFAKGTNWWIENGYIAAKKKE